jgi:hypothetical protein
VRDRAEHDEEEVDFAGGFAAAESTDASEFQDAGVECVARDSAYPSVSSVDSGARFFERLVRLQPTDATGWFFGSTRAGDWSG